METSPVVLKQWCLCAVVSLKLQFLLHMSEAELRELRDTVKSLTDALSTKSEVDKLKWDLNLKDVEINGLKRQLETNEQCQLIKRLEDELERARFQWAKNFRDFLNWESQLQFWTQHTRQSLDVFTQRVPMWRAQGQHAYADHCEYIANQETQKLKLLEDLARIGKPPV